MCQLKITYLDDNYGEIQTVLSKSQKRRALRELSAEELAQLVIDLRTIPQPRLRQMEVDNLAALIGSYGQQQYGPLFVRIMARQFVLALHDVRRFDDTCQEAENILSLAQEGTRPYTVFVAPSSQHV